jgi:O-antigen/teichoic acid export membrane protein
MSSMIGVWGAAMLAVAVLLLVKPAGDGWTVVLAISVVVLVVTTVWLGFEWGRGRVRHPENT